MKRILVLIKGLGRGGAEQLLLNAAPYLDRTRYEYEVAYLLPWKDGLVGDLRDAGVPSVRVDGSRGVAWVGRLAKIVRSREIDLIHAHSPYPATLARIEPGRYIPFVYTEHGAWGRQRSATYWGNALTFSRNDHVFAVSDYVRRSIRLPGPLMRRRFPPVETLYHGLDQRSVLDWAKSDDREIRDELGVPDGAILVGTVGNLRPVKGHSTLLGATELLRAQGRKVHIVLVGRGPSAAALREEAEARGVTHMVTFAGYRQDAQRLISAFDIFVLPSAYEGLSIALLEAMALGKPSVVTNVGGIPEQASHRREAIIVPPGDPAAIALGIESLIDDPSLRTSMGEAARLRARVFDIRAAVARMESVYGELTA